jgi:unsaturated chondroitin disaccharide hydrolase
MKFTAIAGVLLTLCTTASIAQQAAKPLLFAEKQTDVLLQKTAETKASSLKANVFSPRSLNQDGSLNLVSPNDWCAGFFAGNLWQLYEYSGDSKWMDQAKTFTHIMEGEKTDGGSHDVGFKVYCSVGNAYRLTHDEHYKEVIIEAAKTLSTRFNPIVGSIKSWDNKKWVYPVIIDNMMNLELLFEATKLSGDSSFYRIAVTHANTTMKNHYRADYSSYHMVNYDPETGKVLHKKTVQGYADESAWARGQAWGLYGFTMCYRETGNKVYLTQAENIAKFILNNPNLPKDLVPYWDYNDPAIPNVPRDASAAAIMASALYELSTYSTNGKVYSATADKILNSLNTNYQAPLGADKGFLLLHSTGHKPEGSEIDVPIIYADYYYLEALLRQKHLKQGKPVLNTLGVVKY